MIDSVLAAIIDIPADVGYAATFGLIAIETMGIPVPGETALIASALSAHDGELQIELLVVLAAAAAIIGDNVGFMIGRKYGRRIFVKPGPDAPPAPRAARHGRAVLRQARPQGGLPRPLGRAACASPRPGWPGMNKMAWPTFLFWNALGGICWAAGVGLGAYYAGHAFEEVIGTVGVGAAAVVGVAIARLLLLAPPQALARARGARRGARGAS